MAANDDEDAVQDVDAAYAARHELSHALGNHFHRLYYLSDRVRQALDGHDAVADVAQIESLLERVEAASKTLLALARPVSPRVVRFRVADLLESFARSIAPTPLDARAEPAELAVAVAVDPGLVAAALADIGKAVCAGEDSPRPVVVTVRGSDEDEMVELRVADDTGDGDAASVALAAHYLAAHGGALVRVAKGCTDGPGWIIRLPAARAAAGAGHEPGTPAR